jgi:hypothetical protein
MPGPLLTVGDPALCPHGALAHDVGAGQRVRVAGMAVATIADPFVVGDCGFMDDSGPHPCVTVRWATPATRVRLSGVAPLLQSSQGLAVRADGTAAGSVTIVPGQMRVFMS